MDPITEWVQDNWYDLGSLLAQAAIAVILAWYGRKALRLLGTSTASHEAQEASPGLSLLNAMPPRTASQDAYAAPLASVMPNNPGMLSGLIAWLQAPMVSRGPSPWRRAVRWLQAPMRT